MVRGQKILVLGGPGRVLGGAVSRARTAPRGILDPLKHQNQRKTPSTKAKGKKPRAKRTLLHARRASAVADNYFFKFYKGVRYVEHVKNASGVTKIIVLSLSHTVSS